MATSGAVLLCGLMKTVLYLDMLVGDRVQEMKLAGIRRFAHIEGWNVVPVDEAASRPSKLKGILTRYAPDGIIVECSSAHTDLPPCRFGATPVVYLDSSRSLYGAGVTRIVHDYKATLKAAFRELASNRPDGFAFVAYRGKRVWSEFRERAFQLLVKDAGSDCRVFSWRKESDGRRERRLLEWVASLPQKTAVLAANDSTALEVTHAAERLHRSIPRDFTLLGVDNLAAELSQGMTRLSSVQVDFERAGYLAARSLAEKIMCPSARIGLRQFGPLMTIRRETTRGYGRRDPKILKMVEYIRREAVNRITARDVIAHIGYSRRLAELRFREALGHSILDEIESVRFETVVHLLRNRSVSLAVVIDQSGYPSAAALRKAFRHHTGKSLLEWRAANS